MYFSIYYIKNHYFIRPYKIWFSLVSFDSSQTECLVWVPNKSRTLRDTYPPREQNDRHPLPCRAVITEGGFWRIVSYMKISNLFSLFSFWPNRFYFGEIGFRKSRSLASTSNRNQGGNYIINDDESAACRITINVTVSKRLIGQKSRHSSNSRICCQKAATWADHEARSVLRLQKIQYEPFVLFFFPF